MDLRAYAKLRCQEKTAGAPAIMAGLRAAGSWIAGLGARKAAQGVVASTAKAATKGWKPGIGTALNVASVAPAVIPSTPKAVTHPGQMDYSFRRTGFQ